MPPRWSDVYPQGTKEGDEEQGLFLALSRNLTYAYRSVGQLSKDSNLSKERTEEILNKYWKKGMTFQNNDNKWAYWERVPELLPIILKSITKEHQEKRTSKKL